MKQQAPFEVAAHGFYCADAEVQFSAPALSLRLSKFFLSRFESSEMRSHQTFPQFSLVGGQRNAVARGRLHHRQHHYRSARGPGQNSRFHPSSTTPIYSASVERRVTESGRQACRLIRTRLPWTILCLAVT